ncbi:hypothetical protein [Methanosarcina sp.]|uniref:hypothetical protein n=1 Tax=Methanosarcina sp. TaxID=2213 RepID=UPI003C73002C
MAEAVSSNKAKPSPTLNTILMVEDTLKNSPDSVVTVAELKKMLPRQVSLSSFVLYLDEKSLKIEK